MKNVLTLLIAILFTAGMSFAQIGTHEATITQVGNGNSSEIEQTAHFNDGHVATTNQQGNNNQSDIVQEQSSAEAFVSQIGNSNISDLKQAGYNDADVRMTGNSNILGSYNNLGSGVAFQKNGTGSFAAGFNKLTLSVTGNYNLFGLDQEAGTEARIGVVGSRNEVKLFQRDDNDGSTSSYARVDIDGNWNMVDVQQGDGLTETDNFTRISIEGSYNQSEVIQVSSFNSARVNVIGDGNTSDIYQF